MADNLLNSAQDKVVLIGDVGVGKTSIFTRFCTGEFATDDSVAQQHAGEFQKKWLVDGKTVTVTLYDTAGMERHMSTIPHTYFRSAKVLMLIYSIDDTESFGSLRSWSENAESAYISSGLGNQTTVVLVGNKVDLEDEGERTVRLDRALAFAELHGIDKDMVFEISAKDNTNMDEMFDKIALNIHPHVVEAQKSQQPAPKPKKRSIC